MTRRTRTELISVLWGDRKPLKLVNNGSQLCLISKKSKERHERIFPPPVWLWRGASQLAVRWGREAVVAWLSNRELCVARNLLKWRNVIDMTDVVLPLCSISISYYRSLPLFCGVLLLLLAQLSTVLSLFIVCLLHPGLLCPWFLVTRPPMTLFGYGAIQIKLIRFFFLIWLVNVTDRRFPNVGVFQESNRFGKSRLECQINSFESWIWIRAIFHLIPSQTTYRLFQLDTS